ncbi:hypothetical protein F2P58_23375 [Vibrio fortis]|uniref:Uncharacterized protein n=1 Tax=Vibrio fortis TaxID=212667 RepID=A0A5N3QTG0_9VIBR|nr:hypothetical protein [Vibrio fortis]KAB0285458.1 hypothetical protein F2P58_23375 [Vibrio fortis]
MQLSNKQISKLIEQFYQGTELHAVEAVLIHGMTIYRAEQAFEQSPKTLGKKVNRIKKQINLINIVLGA